MSTAGRALQSYLDAFAARDAAAAASLFEPAALAEIPMLKPNRLVGASEIRRGHEAAFRTIAEVGVETETDIAEQDGCAIWAGALTIRRADGARHRHQSAIVVEAGAGRLRRLSLYLNARNIRRWADHAIL